MGYEIIGFGKDGEDVTRLFTHYEDHRAAHALMGALGVPYDAQDICGEGDTLKFTVAELSAAQGALVGAINVDEEYTRGLTFLADCIEYMQKEELSEIEIGFF